MMTKVKMLAAIKAFFEDNTRGPEETREGLQEARDEIDVYIETLGSYDDYEEDSDEG